MPDVKRDLRILDGLEPPDVWGDAATRIPRHGVAGDRPRRRGPAIVVAFAVSIASLAFLVRALGNGPDGDPGDHGATRYETSATVLQESEGSAKLCLGVILESLPPQCGGPPITNWDWDAAEGEESAQGVRWGVYHVVGTYDGASFTLTEAPSSPEPYTEPPHEIVTPCQEPSGGWPVSDPSNAADADFSRAIKVAEREPDFAGAWIDGSPTVLTLAFTGDLDRHEAEVRREWGGPLCLWEFDRTFDELRRIQRGLEPAAQELGLTLLSSSIAVYRNQVDIDVVLADDEALAELERRYGPNAVKVTSALTPVT